MFEINFIEIKAILLENKVLFSFILLSVILRITHLILKLRTITNPIYEEPTEGVSVIITCSNKNFLIKQNLEHFLQQDYHNFEVIVIDECSTDDTQEILEDLQKKYPNLKTSKIPEGTKFRWTKKIALHLGIVAAQNDILLFSEINDIPKTTLWIHSMASHFVNNTVAVLGYASYKNSKPIANYLRQLWFTECTFWANKKICYFANGNNMGFRKHLYLEEKGFTGNTQGHLGYDTEIVAKIAKHGDVVTVISADTQIDITDYNGKTIRNDRLYHYLSKSDLLQDKIWLVWLNILPKLLIYTSLVFTTIYTLWLIPLIIFGIIIFIADVLYTNSISKRLSSDQKLVHSLYLIKWSPACRFYYYVKSLFSKKLWR